MLDYKIVSRPAFTIAGISVRTSNARAAQIGKLWQDFYSQNISARVTDKKSGDIYSLYAEYEGDHTQPYTLVIGHEVDEASGTVGGLTTKTVPVAKYAVFPANG